MISSLFTGTETIKRSLILAGGGIRLAYQAGVIKALEEKELSFSHVDGTSGGIFNAAMIASERNADEMMASWRAVNVNSFVSLLPLKKYLSQSTMSAFGDGDGIVDSVFPALNVDVQKINTFSAADVSFNVCNYSKKILVPFKQSEVTMEHLIAGVSLPMFMPSLNIDGDWYSDAVWIKDANLKYAVQQGAEELWLVWGIGNTDGWSNGTFNQYVHMLEISSDGAVVEELEWIEQVNSRINNGDSPYGQKKPIVLHVIKPWYPLPLDPDLFLKRTDTRTLMNLGYADAQKYLAAIPKDGVPFNYMATKNHNPGVMLNMRQQFHGQYNGGAVSVYLDLTFTITDDNELETLPLLTIIPPWSDQEVCCYGHSSEWIVEDSRKYIVIQAECKDRNNHIPITVKLGLTNIFNFALGLEFKTIQLFIDGDDNYLVDAILYQPITCRLPLLRRVSVSHAKNGKECRSKKRALLKRIYSNEV